MILAPSRLLSSQSIVPPGFDLTPCTFKASSPRDFQNLDPLRLPDFDLPDRVRHGTSHRRNLDMVVLRIDLCYLSNVIKPLRRRPSLMQSDFRIQDLEDTEPWFDQTFPS